MSIHEFAVDPACEEQAPAPEPSDADIRNASSAPCISTKQRDTYITDFQGKHNRTIIARRERTVRVRIADGKIIVVPDSFPGQTFALSIPSSVHLTIDNATGAEDIRYVTYRADGEVIECKPEVSHRLALYDARDYLAAVEA